MTLPQHELKALAIELAATLPDPPPRRVEIVAGELICSEAMDIARRYERAAPLGSPPLSRTLTRRPIEALRSVHVEAKEVQCGVQAWCG